MKRRLAAVVLVAVGALIGALGAPHQVLAHASFESSDPIDGSVLAAAPDEVTLTFSEPVLAGATRATLLAIGTGTAIDLEVVATTDDHVVLAVPSVGDGAFVLRYTVVDPADLHRTVGSISFGVGVAVSVAADSDQLTSSPAQWVANTGGDLALVLGAGAVTVLLVAGASGAAARRRAAKAAGLAGWTLAVAWGAALILDAASVGLQHVQWLELLTGSAPGRRALIGVAVAVATTFATRLLRHHEGPEDRFTIRVLAVCWTAAIAFAALGGHDSIGGPAVVGWALRAVHLGSICAWLGGVAITWWVTRRPSDAADDLWKRISAIAAWGIGITGATGLLMSARTVTTVTALLSTPYGRIVVVKSAVMIGLAVMGAAAARRVATGRSPRRRVLALELGATGAAVALAALLGGQAPAVGARFDQITTAAPQVWTTDVADLTVTASLEPGRPGPNLLQLRVLETRRPSPGRIDGVVVTVSDATGSVVTTLTGTPLDGLLSWDSLVLPSPGEYRVSASVDRPSAAVPEVDGSMAATPPPPPRAAVVLSDAPWARLAAMLAALWAVLIAIGAVAVRRNHPPGGTVDR